MVYSKCSERSIIVSFNLHNMKDRGQVLYFPIQ